MFGKALEYLFPGINTALDCIIVQDGDGARIAAWYYSEPQPTQAEIDAAILPAAKAKRIETINTECRSRLISRFGPAEEQVSRSVGAYGAAEQSALKIGIELMVDAANAAQNAILAAADLAAVEAVTVTWPVI